MSNPAYPMGRPGKPSPLEGRSGPNRGGSRVTAIMVLVVALIFVGLYVWSRLN